MDKECNRCHEVKDTSNFRVRGFYMDNYCRKCNNIRRNEARSNDIWKFLNDNIRSAKSGSKKRGLDFDIDTNYLVELHTHQDKKCAISGIELTTICGQGKVPTNISIDRIDSSKGYTKNNIQLVCYSINLMKRDFSHEVFMSFFNQVLENR